MKIIENIVNWFFTVLAKYLKINVNPSTINAITQFAKFGVVGLSNTVISYILYAGSLLIMRRIGVFVNIDYLISQVVAFALSVMWSFYWNNRFVFKKAEGKQRSIWKSLLKTYVSYSFTGLFLNSILLVLWVEKLGMSEFLAPILNLIISVPLNFLINKFWAFKEH